MEVIAIQSQLLQLVLELVRVHTQVNERSQKHVAADPAEDIQVKSVHFPGAWLAFSTRALIWPAA